MPSDLKPERIEDPTLIELAGRLNAGEFEKVFFAEGDSWFDIFTPAPYVQPNLLDALRTKWHAAIVDTAHVGDEASEMAAGRQARNTKAMLDYFEFDALLLSAGGNDLKNLFRRAVDDVLVQGASPDDVAGRDELQSMLTDPGSMTGFFDSIVTNIRAWVKIRDDSSKNRATPIFLHGYDYLQPRPAPARLWVNGPAVSGKHGWIYPVLQAAGQSDAQMQASVTQAIDTLNCRLADMACALSNVRFIDTRNTLTAASPGTDRQSNDWMDEIHPTIDGFAKLAKKWRAELETNV